MKQCNIVLFLFAVLTLFGHVAMIATTGILYLSGYDILPLYLEDVPMRLVDEPWDARWFAWIDRTKYEGYYTRGGSNAGFRTSEFWYGSLDLYYEDVESSDIFTKRSFLKMKQIEDELMNADDFDKFCKLDPKTKQCVKPQSVLRYFDGTFINIDPIFNDTNFENITNVLHVAATNNATRDDFRFFLAIDNDITQDVVRSKMTRSIISFGTPHEKYGSNDHRKQSETFSGENLKPILEKYDDVSEFKFTYRSIALWMYSAMSQAMKDVLWAGASMAFIFLVILLHTRSLWIAGFAILSIFASFFTGNLIYNLVFRFDYIGYFHILSLFVILGIGADNVFVFYDIWRNSRCDEYLSVAHRLSDCYKRSVFSMLFTSLTTAVAFLSSGITPLLGTRSFGVFSALVVVVNYLSVILYFPAVVIMYHTYFEQATWPCCYPCKKGSNNESSDDKLDKVKQGEQQDNPYIDTEDHEDAIFASRVNPVYEPDDPVKRNYHWSENLDYPTNDSTQQRSMQERGYYVYEANIRSSDWRQAGSYHLYSPGYSRHPERSRQIRNDRKQNGIAHRQNQSPILSDSKSKSGTKMLQKKPIFVRFFRNYYFRFVTHRVIRWLIILLLAGILAFFIYEAVQIEPDNELVSNTW